MREQAGGVLRKIKIEMGMAGSFFDLCFSNSGHHSLEMKKTLNNSSKKYEPILDTAEPFG